MVMIVLMLTIIIITTITIIRRTEGTEEQGVSDPQHPSLLAS